jgi:hypothetical protein
VVLGLELRASPALFCDWYFWDRVLQTICLAGFKQRSFWSFWFLPPE